MWTSRRTGFFTLALFFWAGLYSLVVCYSVGAQDQPTSPPPPPSITPSEQPTTSTSDQLSNLSDQLSLQVNNLIQQVTTLKQQLGESQSSLTESVMSLQSLQKLRVQEEAAAQAQVRSALNRSLWWQRGALVAGGGFIGYVAGGWRGAAIGAASGAAADATLEIAFAIKVKI